LQPVPLRPSLACELLNLFTGMVSQMKCQETIRLICDYLEGRLAPSVEREISQHLSKCATCYQVLEAAEQTLEVYFDADPTRLPHPHSA
jgi:predicted anti-sigma-YlaC factor YlaD